MKTYVQAKQTTSKISQQFQTFKENSRQKSRSDLEELRLEAGEETALHTLEFNFSSMKINPSLLIKTTGGTPMPKDVQQKMEASFNTDFSDVRIHEGKEAESIGAIAYAHGNHIHFQSGKYKPTTSEGQRLLGHELGHVTQQREGRISTSSGNDISPNLNTTLEAEANICGEKAMRGELVHSPIENRIGRSSTTIPHGSSNTVQFMKGKKDIDSNFNKKFRQHDENKEKKWLAAMRESSPDRWFPINAVVRSTQSSSERFDNFLHNEKKENKLKLQEKKKDLWRLSRQHERENVMNASESNFPLFFSGLVSSTALNAQKEVHLEREIEKLERRNRACDKAIGTLRFNKNIATARTR